MHARLLRDVLQEARIARVRKVRAANAARLRILARDAEVAGQEALLKQRDDEDDPMVIAPKVVLGGDELLPAFWRGVHLERVEARPLDHLLRIAKGGARSRSNVQTLLLFLQVEHDAPAPWDHDDRFIIAAIQPIGR